MSAFQLTVNGRPRSVDADPDTPLLWILRDNLGLTGTKFGCGVGLCGSCTVHQDDKAVRACQVPLREAAGTAIVTIEGLAPRGLHPVQRAWIEEDVAQCGYCQPGMIMSATALLADHSHPTDAQIDAVIGEHICRCGSYPRIRKAIHRAAKGGAR